MDRALARVVRAVGSHALAIALVAAVTAVCLVAEEFWGERKPLPLFFVIVVITAAAGGPARTILVTVLSTFSLAYFFLEPEGPAVDRPADRLHLALLVTTGTSAAILSRHVRRSRSALERRFQTVFEHNLAPLVIGTLDGRVLEANDAWLRLVRRSRAQLAGGRVRWRDVIASESSAMLERNIRSLEETGHFPPVELEYVHPDGRRVPALVGGSAMPNEQGHVLVFAADLTEQKRAEAALADQVTKAICDHASAALFMLDERGYCTFMNPAAEAMTGFSFAEVSERPLREVLRRTSLEGRDVASSDGSTSVGAHEDVFVRKSGERFPVVCTARSIHRPGRPSCVLLEVRDVTDQVRAGEEREMLLASERAARVEAERASRVKDEFVATISHELRTPLNAVLGWSELARKPGQTSAQLDKALAIVARNGRHLAQMIAELLDMSRIATGKLRVELVAVDLHTVVEAALETIRSAADAKGIALVATLAEKDVHVLGDEVRLQQVVWNLVSNAIKFTPRGGRVDVELGSTPTSVEIIVRDTGEGIDPEFVPFMFERFRQAESSTSRRHGGLGLGLALVKHVLELHGGTVRAASDGLGRGAQFTVAFPKQTELSVPSPFRKLAGAHILIVDDEPDARELMTRIFEENGAIVAAAASALGALEALATRATDVLVSDIGMPGIDGYELIRRVRTGDAKPDVRAIALTAYARPEDRARALGAGYHLHVSKPVEPAEILAAAAKLLDR